MTDEEEQNINEYNYYSDNGALIGQSEGPSPQEDLFQQAQYVFTDKNSTNQNDDVTSSIEEDIKKFEKERLTISVSHIGRLMDLNKKIETLEQLLEQKKTEHVGPLKKAG